MAYETKPNTGSLFRNDKRETEQQPMYKGAALVGGVEYWVSAWINEAKSTGQKYMSMKYERKEPAAGARGGRKLDKAPEDLGVNW